MSQQTEAAPPSAWPAVAVPAGGQVAVSTLEASLTGEEALGGVTNLSIEVRALRQELEISHASESRLQAELAAAEKALEYTKGEVANLWRAMTTRNFTDAARKAVAEAKQDSRLVRLSDERSRIQSKIADVRSIARRRRWPWSLVG
jgi:hypothetical protein